MTHSASSTLRYNVDHFTINDGVLIAWGWIFDATKRLIDLRLRLTFCDGGMIEQSVQFGEFRADVRDAFPDAMTAAASGFMASAAWPRGEVQKVELIVVDSAASEQCVTIYRNPPSSSLGWMQRLKQSAYANRTLGWRALRLIRHGHFSVLLEKVRRYLANRPAKIQNPLEHLEAVLRHHPGAPALLIVDHDLGGGAPQYRQQLIASHVEHGGLAMLLTYHVPSLTFAVQVYGVPDTKRISLPDVGDLRSLASAGLIGDVFFNNAVSFSHPERIPELLIDIVDITHGKLTLAAHDFYMLCPSHFLMNASGAYCAIPDVSVCRGCLQNNHEGFVNFYPARDVVAWRRSWKRLIDRAQSVCFFSNSTADLFRRVYPDMPDEKISIRPHQMDYFPVRKLVIGASSPLHIGVAGNLGRHKGSRVVAGLARAIHDLNSDVRITVFGMIDEPVPTDVVQIIGRYEHDQLAELIARSGVNLMFVSSVVPETFSYVTHELIAMNLPVVSFDLGAQAEALRDYEFGEVIAFADGAQLLAALLDSHAKLSARREGGLFALNGK